MKELAGLRVLTANVGFELFGHEKGHIEVFKCLRELGADVRVGTVVLESGGAFGRELRSLGFSTFELPFGPQWSIQWLRKHPSLLWRNPAAVVACSRRFRQEIKAYQPTHLFLGNPLVYSYLAPAIWLSRLPLIYRNGDAVPTDSWFNFPIWKSALRHATRVVAISEFVKRNTIQAGIDGEKIEVIHNLAPSTPVQIAAKVEPVRPEKASFPRLVYIGAVSEHKGLLPLVQAVALLRERWPALHLDIVGGSRWDEAFRAQLLLRIDALGIGSQVSLLGFVADPARLYRRAHVHVAPSLWEEPLGNVVVEAKREGVPSVVFPSGGLPEMVRHQIDGWICGEKSAEALAAGIDWLLSDRDRLRCAGEAASADFWARFGPERFTRQWANVFIGLSRPRCAIGVASQEP